MKNLYKCHIRNLVINGITFKGNSIDEIDYSGSILIKDALFYRNRLGVLVSLDYDTELCSFHEAQDFCIQSIINAIVEKNQYPYNECLFYNESELSFLRKVPNKEIKQLKKQYREKKLKKVNKKTDNH